MRAGCVRCSSVTCGDVTVFSTAARVGRAQARRLGMRAAAAAFAAERRTLQYYFKSTRPHDSVPRRCASVACVARSRESAVGGQRTPDLDRGLSPAAAQVCAAAVRAAGARAAGRGSGPPARGRGGARGGGRGRRGRRPGGCPGLRGGPRV
jgi:hypothetical protein